MAAVLVWVAACEDDVGIVRVPNALVVEPSSVDFGDVGVGLRRRIDLVLKNPGEVALEIKKTSTDSLGGELELTGVPEAIAAGAEVLATLAFSPTSAGLREGKIVFETDSSKTPIVEVPVRGRGVDPAISAEPPLIDFGRVLIGRTSTKAVTLTNHADFKVEVKRAELDSGTTTEFVPALDRQWLDPGQTMELVVAYSPNDVGADEGRIRVVDSSPRQDVLEIRARGEGVDADLEIEPLALSFGGLHVGQAQTKAFFVKNIGGVTHQLTTLVFLSSSSTIAGELSITSSTAPTPISLAPSERIQIDVRYVPTDARADTDRVVVESTGLRATAFVDITAIADPAPTPRIVVTPSPLAFGQVEVGQTKPLNVRIENQGNADFTLTSITIEPAGAPFSSMGAPADGSVFPPSDAEVFPVEFAPVRSGAAAAELVVKSTDPANPEIRVPLTGEGTNAPVPSIFVDPIPVVFGQVPRGIPASRPVLIRNDGSANLVVSVVRLTNDRGGRFRLVSPPAPGTTLFPGQPTTFNVEYSDNGVVASYTGTLEIQSNDPTRATVTVPLQASTAPPPPAETDIVLTLTWTVPSGQTLDVDLHLLRPNGTFFGLPSDCCFCNSNPEWGMNGQTEDNPFLDRDDLVGPGPENINLSVAETGTYEVVIHYYSDHGTGSATDVTLNVKLRGTSVATVRQNMSSPERWIAGTIDWDAATRRGTWRPGILGPFPTIFTLCR
ncbi:MAG: choice-of-anchor D domain-containing protein [Deltaproteobacteria bacterium]|nr:choice-of-anchor D domain-containing protein [Deltaproteobacteria bacterium]